MVALFVSRTPLDCCYVRDDDFAEWVEAGWLRPYDDIPDIDINIDEDDIFPYNLESMTYQGRRYGLPYYTDISIWVYNHDMLQAAGFDRSPTTLDELTEQAVKVKEAGLRAPDGLPLDYPITLNFRQSPTAATPPSSKPISKSAASPKTNNPTPKSYAWPRSPASNPACAAPWVGRACTVSPPNAAQTKSPRPGA
jgi:ABC-type glycerol-3-phosphate transport system substrate-binding protein